ncbi:TIGR03943 family putative permease subunit [Streptomyces caniscabiei]|uniref:TIGR03943 family protein n=1 Tax=Streptomyces caniscabiei TaxID=2746961 RepID=A0ABU4MZ51_9ACTN|nr:TIGR03943 family protein [Streptomyces caniscabiei]MBE4737775.1 TIGR03943 family protein [Streptomyces caniscabiei]MBE4757426.1 TIGR03943 family protein [Streptomyces caniscabiei]MBE4769425.1 TIGR03943 family protein [Streptomyces caniscabiei]MBE4784854.1 TIGR03943 family protein [Streptomyces caniscabiei]MBE4795638.1 TIGR03943 family protein [Streptomyces caniscabiei]
MKRPLQALLLLLSGLGLLHATVVTDDYTRYVKEGMHPLLVASGALLLVLGAAESWSLWKDGRNEGKAATAPDTVSNAPGHDDTPDPDDAHAHAPGRDDTPDGRDDHGHDHDHDHGHDHSTPPRVAWLLLLPALSLLFYAPPAIGAYTASREAPKAVAVTDQDDFDPLPKTSPLPITLTDFTARVQQDRDRAIDGRVVEMTGFVTPDKGASDKGGSGKGDGNPGWYLTRAIFSCCAADAQFVKVRVHGAPPPPADTWVALTGTWHPAGTLGTSSAEAAVDARTVKKVPRPPNAYADALPVTG